MNASTVSTTLSNTISDAIQRLDPRHLDLSRLDPTRLDLSRLDVSALDPRRVELPRLDLRAIDLPEFDLPKFDLPKLPVDGRRVAELTRDAAYVGVGAVVVAAHEVDERVRAGVRRVAATVR